MLSEKTSRWWALPLPLALVRAQTAFGPQCGRRVNNLSSSSNRRSDTQTEAKSSAPQFAITHTLSYLTQIANKGKDMKRISFGLVLCALMAAPAAGNPTINGWDASDKFWGSCDIPAALHIASYEKPGSCNEIWVDVGGSAGPTNIVPPAASSTVVDFDYYLFDGQGHADFGVKIVPTPSVETIKFTIPFDVRAGAWLDCIHTDTICRIPTPAPGAILLGSIGIGIVGWLRWRKTL